MKHLNNKPIVSKFEKKQILLKDFTDNWFKTIDCYPVAQRLPIPNPEEKREGIINSILSGINIGEITIVKIGPDQYNGDIYTYESLDGGHRKRFIQEFVNNKWSVNGKYYNQLDIIQKNIIDNYNLSFVIYEPLNTYAKGYIFRALNTSTEVNDQEKLNSYGYIFIANLIRETVRKVDKINNTVHELFEISRTTDSFRYLDFNNDRLKAEELVARVVHRLTQETYLGSSSKDDLITMYENNNFDESDLKKKVKEHFDFLLACANAKKDFAKGLTQQDFKLLSYLNFYLMDNLKKFKILDFKNFMIDYRTAFNLLTDNKGKYSSITNDDCRSFDNKPRMISECFKGYLGAPDHELKIRQTIKWLLQEFNVMSHITVLDTKRSEDIKERENILSQQGWKCVVDNKPLHLLDSVIAHKIPYSEGGETVRNNIAVIRKLHNEKMGTMKLDDYIEVYKKQHLRPSINQETTERR